MQEGIGTKYTGKDRASEDHISINGEVFKLDRTVVFFELDEERQAERSSMNEFLGEHFWIVTLKTIPGQNEEGEGE